MRVVNRFSAVGLLACALSLAACGNSTSDHTGLQEDTEHGDDVGKLWVISDTLDRRTCPSDNCGIVGSLFFREAAESFEEKNGWSRISKYYDAACEAGRSKYVRKSNAKCVKGNGIVNGKLAEWVRSDKLSKTRPADPALTASADESLVAQSDDFSKYRGPFARLAARLISEGRCTPGDFEEMGGWLKSVNEYRDKPVYFTYCGGMTVANKIYIDAETENVLP